jgi:prepilin-type N-terminal cleavage/methylation domain-containing protein
MRISKKSKSGFTLIEMLVVVSVLGILVSLAGYNNTRVLRRSKDAALKVELGLIRGAVYRYALQHDGNFPETLDELKDEQLKKVPQKWAGSQAHGLYFYDSGNGTVQLYDKDGTAPVQTIDYAGNSYADY